MVTDSTGEFGRELRIGQGMDIHAFEPGRPCVLGGVAIPHHSGLAGHSDADALLHAIVDALLGATGRGDIGIQFPNTDPQWRNADSSVFVTTTWSAISAEGWSLINLDCTVLAEAPKIGPYIAAMKERISSLLATTPDRIGIKATTTEKLGAIGRGEGLLASAVVLLKR